MPSAARLLADPAPAPAATTARQPGKRGPRTEAGKARSRMNALRHGLRARVLPLPLGEDEAGFTALADRLVRTYGPEDATEAELVAAIAVAMWREIRADRFEVEALDALAEEADGEGAAFRGGMLVESPACRATVATVTRYQSAASNAVRRAMETFFRYRSARRSGLLVAGAEIEVAECTNEFPTPADGNGTHGFRGPDLARFGPLPMPSVRPAAPGTIRSQPASPAAPHCTNEFRPTTAAAAAPEPLAPSRHPGVVPLPGCAVRPGMSGRKRRPPAQSLARST
jgi:hypothetical protein